MPFDKQRARQYLQDFDLTKLFTEEMGWDHAGGKLKIVFEDEILTLEAVAQKRGLAAYLCPPLAGDLPDHVQRRKIETQVRRQVQEHILIFVDAAQTQQIWQWVRREPGQPVTAREYIFSQGQPGEGLLQRLEGITFHFEEEKGLTIVEVAGRVRTTFDVERVTKRFYDRFKSEHEAFLKFLQGVPDQEMQRWYVSVMLNRLMFVYFIQKKKFLNDDQDYLRNHLARQHGTDLYYRDFLCPLFFEGFAKKEHPPEVRELLGEVPYLNGGIFQRHQVEELYGREIHIPDVAFERLFDFFDGYRWNLDERPLRADDEINPDVLGYIFEKYINQKQMGAYYTKEDITEYIGKNTILPYLLEKFRAQPQEFDGYAWALLKDDPDRYIYPAVRHGCELPLPPEIEAGVNTVGQRGEWNKRAPDDFALPTEIWREVVARRLHYEEVRQKIEQGEVHEINDLITDNLDIRQFAQDVMEACPTPELLRIFFKALGGIKILDPTVGSGAFLFAALNILEPLYQAGLERMQYFLDELQSSGEKVRSDKFKYFRDILGRVSQHPNPRYFILKSIMVHNLYGVDIMEEAVDICKLRLFLKLAAQVEQSSRIEPLPDIDFNIQAGNTLVGFASLEEVEKAFKTGEQGGVKMPKLFMMDEEKSAVGRIEAQAEDIARLFNRLQQQQTELGGEVTPEDKQALRQRLIPLEEELNQALARQYGVDPAEEAAYQRWLASHKPFHWFVEFYGIMRDGGFDVVIGNPPYVEYRKVIGEYSIQRFVTESTNNLFAFCMERALKLLDNGKWFGMIVPVSSISGESYQDLTQLFLDRLTWVSSYSNRPGKLFYGVEQRLTIFISKNRIEKITFSTPYQHWYERERVRLFQTLSYTPCAIWDHLKVPIKSGSLIAETIFRKVTVKNSHYLHKYEYPSGWFGAWFHDGPTYWIRAFPFEPNENYKSDRSNHYHEIKVQSKYNAYLLSSILSSSIFYFFFKMISNCRDFGKKEWSMFRVGHLSDTIYSQLVALGKLLEIELQRTSSIKTRVYTSGKVKYNEYYPAKAKKTIDEIDGVLAQHYAFTDDELDFIINYDIKYRMGGELEGKDG